MSFRQMRHKCCVLAILTLVAALFTAPTAVAQDDVSGKDMSRPVGLPLFDTSPSDKLIEFKAFAGFGFASVLQNFANAIPGLADNQMTADIMIRPGIEATFFINRGVAIGTGLAINDKRIKYAMSIVTSNPESINSLYTRCHFYELYVPVYVSIRCNLSRRLKWCFDIGGFMSYGLSGNMNVSGYTTGQNSLGQPVISHVYYSRDYYDDRSPVLSSIQRNDYGPRLASGLIINRHYNIGATLDVGIRNLAVHNALPLHYRNISFIIEAGYIF